MTGPLNDRLKAVRQSLKLSQRDFSKKIYISQSFLTRMETGQTPINDRTLELVCAQYKVNSDWLRTGKGEMFSETPPDTKLEQLNEIYHELNGLFQDYLIIQAKELLKFQKRSKGQKPS
jgi:transcriptional regulator with XRE-family HTH domain